MRHVAIAVLSLILFATPVAAQGGLSYDEVLNEYPEARAARVTVPSAPAYAESDRASEVRGWVEREDEIIVYGETREFWRVAVRPEGEIGYVPKAAIEVQGSASEGQHGGRE